MFVNVILLNIFFASKAPKSCPGLAKLRGEIRGNFRKEKENTKIDYKKKDG